MPRHQRPAFIELMTADNHALGKSPVSIKHAVQIIRLSCTQDRSWLTLPEARGVTGRGFTSCAHSWTVWREVAQSSVGGAGGRCCLSESSIPWVRVRSSSPETNTGSSHVGPRGLTLHKSLQVRSRGLCLYARYL